MKYFKKMRVNKTLLSYLMSLAILVVYIFGLFSPKQYCLGDVCVERPTFYRFNQFINSVYYQSGTCRFTFSCQNNFDITDEDMNMVGFKNIFGNSFSLVLINESFPVTMGDNYTVYQAMYKLEPYYQCYIFKEPLQQTDLTWDDDMISGAFKDSNLTFALFADDKELLTKALQDICVSDEVSKVIK